ncbi:MAG: hypothetical protein HP477_06160 [Nitrospira sp.]|nr:hypothetical protein [Nitrospira sp.]
MAKKPIVVRHRAEQRNWIAYLCEALVTSGAMPTWEAATYLTENLFGEKPNPRLLTPVNPHEVTSQFLCRLYQPLVEAASRKATLPSSATLHIFTDISRRQQTSATAPPGRRQSLGPRFSGRRVIQPLGR